MGKILVVKGEKTIKNFQYQNNNIDELILGEGIEEIGENAFSDNNIRKILIPDSVKVIYENAFINNPVEELIYLAPVFWIPHYLTRNLIKFTVNKGDYDYIYDTFNIFSFFSPFENIKEINIINSELKLVEKLKIKKFFSKKFPNVKVNILKDDSINDFISKNQVKCENLDEEITNLLNKIMNIIDPLDDSNKQLIGKRINELIEQYQNDISKNNPKFEIESSSLELELVPNTLESLRKNLIISLETIIQNLNTKSRILELSKKINEYQDYLLENKNVSDENDKYFYKIKIIVELASNINNSNFIDKLNKLFEKIKVLITNNLKEDNIIKLTLENQDPEYLFKTQLDTIFDDIVSLNNKIVPYIALLNSLNEKGNSELTGELKELDNILSNLSGKLKDELETKVMILKGKYRNITNENIEKIRKNKTDIIEAQEIELSFRKELYPVLLKIQEKLPTLIKNKDLNIQINLADKLLCGEEIEDNSGIIDLVRDIISLLNSLDLSIESNFTINNKIRVILNSIITHWKDILTTKDTSDIVKDFDSNIGLTSENLIIEVMIMKELYEVKLALENYINDMLEYDKYNGISKSISFKLPSSNGLNNIKSPKSKIRKVKKNCTTYYGYDKKENIDIIKSKYLNLKNNCQTKINII